jgi:uncharacterized membrane protein
MYISLWILVPIVLVLLWFVGKFAWALICFIAIKKFFKLKRKGGK